MYVGVLLFDYGCYNDTVSEGMNGFVISYLSQNLIKEFVIKLNYIAYNNLDVLDIHFSKKGDKNMTTYDQLLKEYDEQKLKMDTGDDVDTLELMFMGYALDAVDTTKELFKIDLTFEDESIKDVEIILDALSKSIQSDKPTSEQIMNFAKMYSSYIGQVIKLRWDGGWKDESEYSIKNGPALYVKGQHLFLLSKTHRRLINGSEDNVWHFYQVTKQKIEGIIDNNKKHDITKNE